MLKKPKGTQDFFGEKLESLEKIRNIFFDICKKYNFSFIKTPTFEFEELFTRGVGENSDIVTKEIYSFVDKNGRRLALRPEGTTCVVRAIVENKLLINNKNGGKFAYFENMFRYEQPQSGRYREFFQAGVELFSEEDNPYDDFEIIDLANNFLKKLNINDYLLKINYLGKKDERENYIEALKKFFNKNKNLLDKKMREKLKNNPMRILDDNSGKLEELKKFAPGIYNSLGEKSKLYLKKVQKLLSENGIKFETDYHLVRGLSYYTGIVFEFVNLSKKTAQNTLIGGGRYSDMLNELCGIKMSGFGFGAGVERLIENSNLKSDEKDFKIFVSTITNCSEEEKINLLKLVKKIRNFKVRVEFNTKEKKVKKVFTDFFNKKYNLLILPSKENMFFEIINNKKERQILEQKNVIKYLNTLLKNEKF